MKGLIPVLVAVSLRPGLWGTAAICLVRSAAPGWWRHWPFLPLPAPLWIEFRLECATGRRSGPLAPSDVVAWLEWCKQTPRSAR